MNDSLKNTQTSALSAGNMKSKLLQCNAANCIQPTYEAPSTPDHIKKYRNSYKQQPGVSILHYGAVDDKISNDKQFGKPTKGSIKASDCLVVDHLQGVKELVTDIKEQKYASNQREPLGERAKKNYEFPTQAQEGNFQFGAKTKSSEYTSKEVMFPQQPYMNDPEVQKQYTKTHGNYEAGEQKNRNYDWKVDPKDFRFGKAEKLVPNEMQQCLNMEALTDEFPKTIIVKKKQEDFRNFKEDPLGRPKNLAQVNSYVSKDSVYGIRPKDQFQCTAAMCLQGAPTLNELQPDKDLGKTNKFGFRNITKPGDENRVFGTPTIRDDMPKKNFKSIADPNNYGDELPAVNLLFPQKYDHMGISQEEFLKRRSKQEIKSIFESVGYKYKIGKFEGIYQRACDIEQSEDGTVSVQTFSMAISEMGHID